MEPDAALARSGGRPPEPHGRGPRAETEILDTETAESWEVGAKSRLLPTLNKVLDLGRQGLASQTEIGGHRAAVSTHPA